MVEKGKDDWKDSMNRQYYGTLFEEEEKKDEKFSKFIKMFADYLKDKRGLGMKKTKEVV